MACMWSGYGSLEEPGQRWLISIAPQCFEGCLRRLESGFRRRKGRASSWGSWEGVAGKAVRGGAGSGGADVFLVELAAGGATVLVDGESISSPVAKVTDEFNI